MLQTRQVCDLLWHASTFKITWPFLINWPTWGHQTCQDYIKKKPVTKNLVKSWKCTIDPFYVKNGNYPKSSPLSTSNLSSPCMPTEFTTYKYEINTFKNFPLIVSNLFPPPKFKQNIFWKKFPDSRLLKNVRGKNNFHQNIHSFLTGRKKLWKANSWLQCKIIPFLWIGNNIAWLSRKIGKIRAYVEIKGILEHLS